MFAPTKATNVQYIPIIPVILPITYREIIMRDIAALSGNEVIEDLENFDISKSIGSTFTKAVIKKNKTYLIGSSTNIDSYVGDLNSQMEDMTKADQERMKKRIAKIKGSVGVIKVGGETDAERLYWFHKIKDAVNAVNHAKENGVVPGGGIALKNLNLPGFDYPHKVLCDNMGEVFKGSDSIIDSVDVVKNSVRKAVSAARQVLMVKTVIADKRLTIEEEYNIMMKQ